MLRPVMQNGRVKICPGRPYESVNFGIKADTIELRRIAERTIQLAFENRLEVDLTAQPVIKPDAKAEGADALERVNSIKLMCHGCKLLQRCDWCRSLPLLKPIPIGQKLILMKLRPRLDKPLLPLRNRASNESDWGDGENRDLLLIVGVKMRRMETLGKLDEHAYNDAIKARKFRHSRRALMISRVVSCSKRGSEANAKSRGS